MQRTNYPEWSWSPSRHHLFEECRRKYFYHYYGAHNGWLRDAPPLVRQTYRLKQMTNLYLVFGDAMHKMAEQSLMRWFQAGQLLESAELVQRVRNLLNQAYKDSQQMAAWMEQPNKRKMLHEMYYDGGLPPKLIDTIRSRIPILADRFLDSRSLADYMAEGSRLIELERLNTMEIAGTKIYVKLDFMFRHDDRYIIVDWKTGQEDERNKTQLRLYGLYVHRLYEVPYDRLDIRTEYLLSGQCYEDRVTAEEMSELEEHVVGSIVAMQSVLADPKANVPLPMEAFEPTEDRRRCRRCSYQEICEYAAS
ncbi:PD-(D/E)XK nuclease family protein [Paenibacillus sp. 481]|uniref:PD-(D/E)XK nuclease family protein n=1 Tax=Paenibacillus sp. 481 TaxID=2835869 RepID=UPI001E511FCC|nr:PD-(D/E)XK nuclease family protein [Paenibacillus sp. 481]UHA74958.1 PD-(D/E)XK nuclease family protein [Paenibacillus sp. 481]